MRYIRERKLKDGGVRYQAEIRLKGHSAGIAVFDRKTDAKNWVQKEEVGIRCRRQQTYLPGKSVLLKKLLIAILKNNLLQL
ncbi:MAG: hypothetical protein HWD61_12330 [Parachlamydiaceae bacterium]|nr:MAG: hypothetical protein HWD61_12330 [Parachlamydiaceae bacterium]